MIKFIIIAVIAWIIGVFGWAQVIGGLQNIKIRKNMIITVVLWLAILGAIAYFAIMRFGALWPILIGYTIAFIQIISQGRIE